MILDVTPRLPFRASLELTEIWRARLREILEARENVRIRGAARGPEKEDERDQPED